uniref:DNA-directed RNA polymerase subunit beta'' n=1 Tax=Closterium baillyanum TaxID=1416941 RepID=A0A191T5Z0_9VIRI|nr:beta'' subunit of RNA polymerase [Closterium baillyanum]ANI25792.1 beta'' subunit of RNA polymerase [Closterium baillyanum]
MARLTAEYGDIIFYNQVMDKGAMRQLIGRLMTYLGSECTAQILDQLKTLGFRHATQAGISLGIDDLLTTPSKTWLIQDAEHQTHTSEEQYRRGSIHAVEKLRHVVETWHTTSEYLKREMSSHFRTTDPLNPVHMMSFSGARGNVSQVHQLVGMRGLMSNPQGNIIDLPIQSNLREGLSLTEYIISCYGARKGVVDTAVRTADAGYLTRRLVEVVQHIVVRNRDCETFEGVRLRSIRDRKTSTPLLSLQDRLVGRILARDVYISERCIAVRNQDLAPDVVNRLVASHNEIFVRSPLTCKSMPRACQMCYGWDLSCGNLVELGAAIGIIAGQSIGEPGTQLTLRTFHTGGVFTGDVAEHVRAPFNGVVRFYTDTIQPTRNRHGRPAWTCPEALSVIIEDGTKKRHVLNVPQYSLLLVRNHQYVQARQIIAEVRASTAPLKEKIEKDIYCGIEGEVFYEHTGLRAYCLKQRKLPHGCFQTRLSLWLEFASLRNYLSPIVDKTSYIWIFSGRLSEFSGINVSFLYRIQDYIQADLPIGKQTHVLTQYDPLVAPSQYRQRFVFPNSKIPENIFSQHTGFVYLISEQDTWMLTLSAVDQFDMTMQSIDQKILPSDYSQRDHRQYSYININLELAEWIARKLSVQNQKTMSPSQYTGFISYLSTLRLFQSVDSPSHREHRQRDHRHGDIGLIGRFDTLFEEFSISYLRNVVSMIQHHFSTVNANGPFGKLLFSSSSVYADSLGDVSRTIFLNKPLPLDEDQSIENRGKWIMAARFINWVTWGLLNPLSTKQKSHLGQSICKGVSKLPWGIFPESGHILSVCENSITIRLAKLYLVPAGTIVHTYHKQAIHAGDTLITFAYERLKASDIIQGLPKAEQLLEARIGNQVVVHLHMRFEYLVGRIKEQLRNYVGSLTQMDLMLSQASLNRARKALEYSQMETVDQIQKVYLSQGVYISDKHVEVIVRQMSSKVVIVENTDLTAFSPKTVIRTSFPYDTIGVFFPGELIEIAKAERMNRVLHKPLPCKPVLLGITKASLNTNSFLSEASFERTITVLSRSAIQGRIDWLKGLKENVLLSNMIPAGTGCEQVDLQAMLYKNQQMYLKKRKHGVFASRDKRIFCLYKPLLRNRDWLHNYLTQVRQHKVNEETKTLILPDVIKNFVSIKKPREYRILSKSNFTKKPKNKPESPSSKK